MLLYEKTHKFIGVKIDFLLGINVVKCVVKLLYFSLKTEFPKCHEV